MAEKLLLENGGIIVDSVADDRLTHIVMDDEDSSRYVQLVRRTSK